MDDQKSCNNCTQGIMWWAMLVVAVLAVPAVGIVISLLSGTKGLLSVAIFIVTCWVCTYLGMRLMHSIESKKKN